MSLASGGVRLLRVDERLMISIGANFERAVEPLARRLLLRA